jgi:hypothetical protein
MSVFTVGIDFEVLRLEIEASTPEEARDKALKLIKNNPFYQSPDYWVGYVDDSEGQELL